MPTGPNHPRDGTGTVTGFDLTGDAAGHIAPDPAEPGSLSANPSRTNRRGERRPRRNDDEQARRRLDAADITSASLRTDHAGNDASHQRYTERPTRNPMPWPTGPTRPLQAVARPAIPSAREETVELLPLATPPSGATALANGLATSVPTQPDHGTAVGESRPARPATDDAAAEVWTLVEQAQAGDANAFAQIYQRYLDTVFRFIYFRVSNRQVAEDLTAETFLRALKRIGSVTWQGRDLGAWLVTIARNLVADYFKSGRYRFEVATGDVLESDGLGRTGVDAQDRAPESSPEAAVVDHITHVELLNAVQRLNPEQRECIVLRFLQGFSVAETAQAMGKNEGAIKALQYRAVRALHRLLPEGFRP